MLNRVWIVRVLLAAVVLLAAGCQPVRPVAPTDGDAAAVTPAAEAAAAAATPAASAATGVAGTYTGKLSIAGLDLDVVVKLQAQDGGYAGTIDIPQQGATGIPLENVTVDGTAVHFEMLPGPQVAKFDGELAADGTISGKMVQSGYEGTFTLAPEQPVAAAEPGATPAATPLPAGVESIYTDPEQRYSVPVPTSWQVTEADGYMLMADPDELIKVYTLVTDEADLAKAIADAWTQVDPSFALEIDQTVTPPNAPGIEQTLSYGYKTGDATRLVQAQAQRKAGKTYVNLYDVQMEGVQKRGAQLSIVSSGFKVLGNEQADLSNATPLQVTAAITEPLEAFIDKYMAAFNIPGAAVGIVQDGKLVYAQGFGVTDAATGTPVTPQTQMMIGSTTKSFTTMLMAQLVDEGKMTWDTPVVELFPSFQVKDPELTQTITMRNLVCACTGVPRRDMEWLFNFNTLTPTDTIASLAGFEFFTKFGEAFQYSNQMVTAAGYIAGQVAEDHHGDLEGDYTKALQGRILDPIGMISTTLSFDAVEQGGNYATPHAQRLDATYTPIPLDLERSLSVYGPAGALWSNVEDMAQYMITQLADGVAPDGRAVVSAENLNVTREPQIAINANTSYGLGWMITSYYGQPVITHGGNTLGFTSEFTFLPEANLGVIVLSNAQGANLFNGSVTTKLLELVFEQPAQTEQQLDFLLTQIEESVAKNAKRMSGTLDEQAVQPYLGTFTNSALGDITLSLSDGKMTMDAGEFTAGIKPFNDPDTNFNGYMMVDPPAQGLLFLFQQDDSGAPVVIMRQGAEDYTFTKVQ